MVKILHGHSRYMYNLSQYSPLFDFRAVGYCIATSEGKWALQLGGLGGLPCRQHLELIYYSKPLHQPQQQ